jgi:mono/diheme cytochrome c family protein
MKTLLLALLAAACGGGSTKPAPTTPPPADPVPMKEPAATGPTTPADPAAPAEPAKPAAPPAPDPAKVKAELLAAETAAFEKAKPVFERYCASCHTKGGKNATAKKLGHFDMTTYPFGGHHAMEISSEIRKALAIGGGKPTMPFNNKGAVKGDELALIAAWADAFDASHKGGAHEGHGGHGEHKH